MVSEVSGTDLRELLCSLSEALIADDGRRRRILSVRASLASGFGLSSPWEA